MVFASIYVPQVTASPTKFVTCCVGSAQCTGALTTSEDQESYRQRMLSRPTEREMVTLARQFVEKQSEATPGAVGGPVDLLVLDARGSRWLQVKARCR